MDDYRSCTAILPKISKNCQAQYFSTGQSTLPQNARVAMSIGESPGLAKTLGSHRFHNTVCICSLTRGARYSHPLPPPCAPSRRRPFPPSRSRRIAAAVATSLTSEFATRSSDDHVAHRGAGVNRRRTSAPDAGQALLLSASSSTTAPEPLSSS